MYPAQCHPEEAYAFSRDRMLYVEREKGKGRLTPAFVKPRTVQLTEIPKGSEILKP